MIIRVSNKDREILKDLSKYIWWQDSDYAINHNTLRLIASAMCLANNVEDFIKVISLDKELLKEALKQAQPGWFDARNWHFWHYRLYGSDTIIPKLKKRKCMENSKQKIYNKFSLSKDENIFLAKRNLIDNIYKSARLEGIAVTFPQTEAIFNGVNVSTLKVDELVAINNLKHAWQFIFDTMQYPKVDFAFVCEVNRIIGSGLYNNAGFLRSVSVDIGGTSWKPNLPMKADIIDDINKINNTENATEKAIDLMLFIMRKQMFLDGNKRTAMICANRVLIENGAGLINVNVEHIEEFKTELIKYYETNEKDKIRDFLFEKCLNGIDIKEPSQEEIAEQEANTRMFQSYKTQKESNIENKKIEEMRRELQLKAIEQFKTNKTPENSTRKRDKKR